MARSNDCYNSAVRLGRFAGDVLEIGKREYQSLAIRIEIIMRGKMQH